MRTLLALLVPDAEPVVSDLRTRFDPAAALGFGAHITLLYPFLDTRVISDDVLRTLRGVTARHRALSFCLDHVGRFPSTVWLGPRPADAIVALASELEAAFPDRPATGQRFEPFVPHVSVARNMRSDQDAVAATLEDRLRAVREISCHCAEVHVMQRDDDGWRVHARAALGAA